VVMTNWTPAEERSAGRSTSCRVPLSGSSVSAARSSMTTSSPCRIRSLPNAASRHRSTVSRSGLSAPASTLDRL